jgi:hypothetical protein
MSQKSPEDGHMYRPKHAVMWSKRTLINAFVNCCERGFYPELSPCLSYRNSQPTNSQHHWFPYLPLTLDWISLHHSKRWSLHKLNWSKQTVNSYWTAVQVKNQSYIMIKGQSTSLSWCQAPIEDQQPIFSFFFSIFRQLQICWCGVPSLMRGCCWDSPV